jgi:hypothetical protein
MLEVDPMRLTATIGDGQPVLDPDPRVRLAHLFFGGAFTILLEDAFRDREGRS